MSNILISLIILGFAVCFQWASFVKTQKTRKKLKNIFPKSFANSVAAERDEEENTVCIKLLKSGSESKIFVKIVESINYYLRKNKGATDYAILKDITDRNCDSLEDEIDSTASVPIYIGLCGTVLGIVFGVAILAFGGGLDQLLSKEAINGAQGIKELMQGVAVAMLTTFFGVIFTIFGSLSHKESQKINEQRKNEFLSWMQGELLPQMNTNMVSTLDMLQRNLNQFNKDFSDNSKNLKDIFGNINTTYDNQAEILRLIKKLDINGMADANVRVLRELQGCTSQISLLQSFLNQSNQYLSEVQKMNQELTDYQDRTKLIENMGEFFQSEIEQIGLRKAAISKAVADIDAAVGKSFEDLKTHTVDEYGQLKSYTAQEHAAFLKAIEDQQAALNTRLAETTQILDELKNLVAVKEQLEKMTSAYTSQTEKLDTLAAIMKRVADKEPKVIVQEGGSSNGSMQAIISKPEFPKAMKWKMPWWAVAIMGITSASVVSCCVLYALHLFEFI
ncbi:MAG: MotA/TolQ/ExbB proton channel family protein [Bacteroidales bacterium]|nr:MotA/TolQ/ExbB proton channel family protein [Bacteroidales bacterium]